MLTAVVIPLLLVIINKIKGIDKKLTGDNMKNLFSGCVGTWYVFYERL